jgi:hypothetical protein
VQGEFEPRQGTAQKLLVLSLTQILKDLCCGVVPSAQAPPPPLHPHHNQFCGVPPIPTSKNSPLSSGCDLAAARTFRHAHCAFALPLEPPSFCLPPASALVAALAGCCAHSAVAPATAPAPLRDGIQQVRQSDVKGRAARRGDRGRKWPVPEPPPSFPSPPLPPTTCATLLPLLNRLPPVPMLGVLAEGGGEGRWRVASWENHVGVCTWDEVK